MDRWKGLESQQHPETSLKASHSHEKVKAWSVSLGPSGQKSSQRSQEHTELDTQRHLPGRGNLKLGMTVSVLMGNKAKALPHA